MPYTVKESGINQLSEFNDPGNFILKMYSILLMCYSNWVEKGYVYSSSGESFHLNIT